jgi:NitT/TauT family transport system substrate-binding protein
MAKEQNLSRRSFVKAAGVTAAVVAGGALAAGCSSSSNSTSSTSSSTSSDATSTDSTEAISATIGYWGGSPCELPVYVAIEQGFFEEAGIDPNIVLITSDTSILLANDEIDCFMSTPGDFPALYNGENMKLLDTIHVGCWSGVTLSDDINNCADLEGKKVGTSMINGPAYTECMSLCARQGGDPSKIEWVTYKGSLLQEALANGEIDAACGSDSVAYPIQRNLGAKFFYLSAQELGQYYCCFIGCNSNTLEKTPELGDRLAKAFGLASDFIQEDPEGAINMSMEKGYASADYPDIQRGLTTNYMFDHGNEDDFRASIKERWQELYDANLLSQAPTDESEVDAYLEELVDMVADWRGEAADNCDTEGAAAHLAERGDAYQG